LGDDHPGRSIAKELGRLLAIARRQRGQWRPGTFALLGFTHYCGWTRDGSFNVKLKTQSKRLTRKLKALRQEAWRQMWAYYKLWPDVAFDVYPDQADFMQWIPLSPTCQMLAAR
jgi:hypothetical protein